VSEVQGIFQSQVKNILTRSSGFLLNASGQTPVSSHSLNPYVGYTFENSLCGVGCYMRSNGFVTKGRYWGSFLEVLSNAEESYAFNFHKERAWARKHQGVFGILCASATDPFLPHERRCRITEQLLCAMLSMTPDRLILQTHSHRVTDYLEIYQQLKDRCDLRFHISIESDRDRLAGLPPPSSSLDERFLACKELHRIGFRVAVNVAPLLPVESPEPFFQRVCDNALAVVIDHFVLGDVSPNGPITRRTQLPVGMSQLEPASIYLSYHDEMIAIARQVMPGRVGTGADRLTGQYA
jgi:DNA repair photolyase